MKRVISVIGNMLLDIAFYLPKGYPFIRRHLKAFKHAEFGVEALVELVMTSVGLMSYE